MRKIITTVGASICIICVAAVLGIFTQRDAATTRDLVLSDYPKLFAKEAVIVIDDNASEVEMQAANDIASYLENETGSKPLVRKYSEISKEDKRNYNLIIVGTPKTNPLVEEVYAMTNATTEEYPGEGKGTLEILRSPWNKEKALLLVVGSDVWGVKAGSDYIPRLREISRTTIEIKPEAPMELDLSLSEPPLLNKTVKLTFGVTALWDLPNTSIEILLPEGFEVVSGNLSWKGDIAKDQKVEIQCFIKAIKTGNWTIKALARSYHGWGFYGSLASLYVSVSEETAIISKTPPIPKLPPMEEEVGTQIEYGGI